MAKLNSSQKGYESSGRLLSKRSEIVQDWEDFLVKYLNLCISDEYNPDTNPNGYINLGTAVNNICNDIVYPKITSNEIWSCDTTLLQYREGHGIFRLRKALAVIMTEMLNTHKPVDPNNLFFSVGVTSSIDMLSHCLADPGDVILTPTPVYGRIYTDLLQRAQVEMWPIPIIEKDSTETDPQLSLQKVKDAYDKAIECGKNVRGILLLNPSNPLGDVYSPQLMMEILEFCNEKCIHAVVDEVYALSVHSESSAYQSVLCFSWLPNPMMTHVLYGMSKDFALAGLRIGAIHTKCPVLQRCLMQLSFFQDIPFPIMAIAARMWEDLDWCRNFVRVNKQRLQEKFQLCKMRLEKLGLPVRNSEAAFFVWVNFRQKCNITDFSQEVEFFNYLIEKFHLYFVPGKELFCEQPGWFRITFTGSPDHVTTGLSRLEEALKQYPTFIGAHHESAVTCKESENKEETLEDLVTLLKKQMKCSNWLSENSTEKWKHENPELAKLFVKKDDEI